ncbi:hypothetical protein MJD09_09480, partial [bacterium]|nr:hypothetical protein [bacterium]
MKSVLVVGLFPEKSSVFLSQLSRHFRVIMFRQQYFSTPDTGSVEFAEDLVDNSEVDFPWPEFCWELHRCTDATERQIAKHFPQAMHSSLNAREFEKLYNLACQTFYVGRYLCKLHEKVDLDLVIVNADCSATRRVLVIEAKKLGIPTLNVEHGYNHAVMPNVKTLATDFIPTPMFISDFVNFDNALEQQKWEEFFDFFGIAERARFVANGTPNDITINQNIAKGDARELLGLDQSSFTVTIIGTWNEARDSSIVLKSLLQEVQFYESTLTVLADIAREDSVQILIKLHPAYARKPIFVDTSRCLKKLSERLAVEIKLITTELLSEVISASDLVISPTDSSVIWESFLALTPGIIYPATQFLTTFFDKRKLKESSELASQGCLKYVFDQAELKSAIHHFKRSENRARFEEAARNIRARYELENLSPEEKSARICSWIKETLDDREKGRRLQHKSEVISKDPKSQVEWLFATGRSFIEENRLKEGLSLLTKVLDIAPQHDETLQLLGDLFERLGESAKADKMRLLASQNNPLVQSS